MSSDPIQEKTVRDKVEFDATSTTEHHAHRPSDFYAPYLDLPYYHGLVRKADVTELLNKGGEFLLRFASPEIAGQPMRPVLSVYPIGEKEKDSIVHVEVKNMNGKYSVDSGRNFDSIETLVSYFQMEKKSVVGSASAQLIRPAKRHRWQLRNSLIRVEKKLGAGSFAQVFLCVLRSKNREREVAVKICRETKNITKENMLEEVMREVHIMKPLRHQHVVRLFGVAMDYEPIMIVMEYVKGGSLQRYLRKNVGRVTSIDKMKKMMLGAALGLEYIHSMKLIHRDIAARNCLFDRETCKISDFGLARAGESYKLSTVRKVPYKNMAPELFLTFKYTPKSDVYAFGVMCWEIWMDGKEPYPDKRLVEVKSLVISGHRLEFSPCTPSELISIINSSCWGHLAEDRLTMLQIAKKLEEYTNRYISEKTRSDNMEEDVEPGMPPKQGTTSIIGKGPDQTEEKTDYEASTYSTRSTSSNSAASTSSEKLHSSIKDKKKDEYGEPRKHKT